MSAGKPKTHKGTAKRFRKTASGHKRRRAMRNHILTKKATKRKRRLRGMAPVHASDAPAVKRLLRDN